MKLCKLQVMVITHPPYWVLLLFTFILKVCSQPFDYPFANLSTTWINNPSLPHSVSFDDGSTIRAILLRGSFGPRFACGFFCNGNCESYLFAIFIVQTNSGSGITLPSSGFPQVVWTANRNNPVKLNSTLQLSSEGDLVLKDNDGTITWSTNTAGKSVAGLNLTDEGNLILFDKNNSTIWQSFDHPTDCLVPGQKLVSGRKLTPSISTTNWTEGDLFSLFVTNSGFFAYLESNPPVSYYESRISGTADDKSQSYVKFRNGSIAFYILSTEPNDPDREISIPLASSAQYLKFENDGHLRVYEWGQAWKQVADLLTGYLGLCNYPMVCGKYGICSNEQCSCPGSPTYFRQINERQPSLGCSEITHLSCEASQTHSFLELNNITYFTLLTDIANTDMETCKRTCLENCSCKAALFRYSGNSSLGNCQLPTEIFSLMNNDKQLTHYDSSAFLKVQLAPVAPSPLLQSSPITGKGNNHTAIILGSTIGALFVMFIVIGTWVFFLWRKKHVEIDEEEDHWDQLTGLPKKFCYEDLTVATDNFVIKLGEGGFGSVFQGTLSNSTMIAVKCLDGLGQIKKSFLAEVKTIGSIHHVNLVRLIGFCAEKSHRLLVYEYMCNGSLDKWIFHKNQDFVLDWNQRKKIILDIAKGLAYLHEDCRQKIVHLDIKPQNILLDENFNAKVSDFGLSKLIDRDQSQVMTTMRGTPGYLAPEWLSSVITEKVDVYSFGVVVMEILCGRKNLDRSQPEEAMHLLSLFKQKAEEQNLLDMVDSYSEEMHLHGMEVVQMMKVAAWCLQSDFTKRPSMSVVVKVLEGVMDVEDNLDYNFWSPPVLKKEVQVNATTPLLPSLLSGPR